MNERMIEITFVRSSEQVTMSIRELYIDCNNPKCLARDVMTISPKALIQNMINLLPEQDRKEVLQQASLFS